MNIIQISQEIQKSWVEIHLCPKAKNDCHCANFHKTDAYSTTSVMNSHTHLQENPTNGLVIKLQTDGPIDGKMWSPHKMFSFHFVKNA
jgi:hypothetical protein